MEVRLSNNLKDGMISKQENTRITKMDQVCLGDILMRGDTLETMCVTTKFQESVIEGLGTKGGSKLRQTRFFLGTCDIVRIGHANLLEAVTGWIKEATE